jgi:translocation protein SEC63
LDEKQGGVENLAKFVESLEKKGDARVQDVRKALEGWGRLELVDVSFKGRFSFFFTFDRTLLI